MSYFRYLFLLADSGDQHIECCVFVFIVFVWCTVYCQFSGLCIVGSLFGNLLRLFKTKRDDFNFAIINVANLDSKIPPALACGVNIVQLIR